MGPAGTTYQTDKKLMTSYCHSLVEFVYQAYAPTIDWKAPAHYFYPKYNKAQPLKRSNWFNSLLLVIYEVNILTTEKFIDKNRYLVNYS